MRGLGQPEAEPIEVRVRCELARYEKPPLTIDLRPNFEAIALGLEPVAWQ